MCFPLARVALLVRGIRTLLFSAVVMPFVYSCAWRGLYRRLVSPEGMERCVRVRELASEGTRGAAWRSCRRSARICWDGTRTQFARYLAGAFQPGLIPSASVLDCLKECLASAAHMPAPASVRRVSGLESRELSLNAMRQGTG